LPVLSSFFPPAWSSERESASAVPTCERPEPHIQERVHARIRPSGAYKEVRRMEPGLRSAAGNAAPPPCSAAPHKRKVRRDGTAPGAAGEEERR
jgi:hypothetical protein